MRNIISLALLSPLFLFGLADCTCAVECPPQCPDQCDTTGCLPGTDPDPQPTGEPEVSCVDDGDCAEGACFGGVCTECDRATACADTETCIDGLCVVDDECAAENRCGQGGTCCPQSGECIDTSAVRPAPPFAVAKTLRNAVR